MTREATGSFPLLVPGAGTDAYLAGYAPDSRRYDELLDENGRVRAHWRALVERLNTDKAPDNARRALELTRRLIVENGVAYNVYSDPQGADRPWALDPLPLLLSQEEWRSIETGVEQRARALEALLADLYGPQRLLAEGLVPPELPFGHPNFLWPCHGLVPRGGSWLHIYAADLARAPDGRWWVLADRTQAPSGAGYALENRDIVEQVLPEAIRSLAVRRVRDFFGDMREGLRDLFSDDANPLVVILTPGPFNETYFEHAYMARQLGLPLVEGQDLTVRNEVVYLKTLGGLKRVHTIVRRLDDDYCDPVELRGTSALGVPGLLSAIRARNVVVTNALGTGVLESAAWLGFLPGIAERLLGEALQLPAVATWWCGEKPALDEVLPNLERLVIKPTYPNQHFEPLFGDSLAAEGRSALIRRLQARPYAYVAQEHVALSQAPVWHANGAAPHLAARAFTIRVYAIATQAGFRVLPGGLARVAAQSAPDVVSAQRGGSSKDIWVLSAGESERASGNPQGLGVTTRADELPSRLAENLFWLGRYTVRCADNARLLYSTVRVRVERSVWIHAVRICRGLGVIMHGTEEAPVRQGRPLRDRCRRQADRLVRLAGAQPLLGALLARRGRFAVAGAGGRRLARRAARDAGAACVVAGRALRLRRRGHDRTTRVCGCCASDDAWSACSSWLASTRAAPAFGGRHASKPGRVAAGRMPQHQHLSRRGISSRRAWVRALDLLVRDLHHPVSLAFQCNSITRDLQELASSLKIAGYRGLETPVPELSDADLLALKATVRASRPRAAHWPHS